MLQTDVHSIADLLSPSRVLVKLAETDKFNLIDALVDSLDGASEVTDLDQVRADVRAREALMSTGVGQGLALPHARSRAVTNTLAAFAVTESPVDYEALDGQPVRLAFLLVGPEEERGRHVRLLSRLSRLMARDTFRADLLDAPDAEAVIAAFRDAEAAS